MNFLLRTIGPDDLIAGITPRMSPADLSFTPRTDSLEAILNSVYGKRDSIIDDPEEQQMENCFSRDGVAAISRPAPRQAVDRRDGNAGAPSRRAARRAEGDHHGERRLADVSRGSAVDVGEVIGRARADRPRHHHRTGRTAGDVRSGEYEWRLPEPRQCDGIRMQIAAMDSRAAVSRSARRRESRERQLLHHRSARSRRVRRVDRARRRRRRCRSIRPTCATS